MQFNNQARQCNISAKALQVAEERYDITKKRFQNGGITVTDLNTAQKELDSASCPCTILYPKEISVLNLIK